MRDFGDFGAIQVSDKFKQTVTDIAENDTDVQILINGDCNFTSVAPIIHTVINGEGTFVTKATRAVLTLQKDTTSRATVMVNIEDAKATQIVVLTRTVIDKSHRKPLDMEIPESFFLFFVTFKIHFKNAKFFKKNRKQPLT